MAQTAISTTGGGRAAAGRGAVRLWLQCMCLLVFAMVVVGGATRLTGSGLSITEWRPIMGTVPPLSEAAWQEALEKYRQIPQYRLINRGMSLAEFKTIYWWEWGHRFLGRLIGVAFALPLLVFWLSGRVDRPLAPKLVGILVLGGLQGALGWYMVMSGLADRVDVSQYRLAAHLTLAVAIFGALQWVAMDLRPLERVALPPVASRALVLSAAGLAILILLQVALGGLVAGLKAGYGYNTWPLMDGALVPDGLGVMSPWHLNLFENALTVQFQHRMAAYAIVVWAVAHHLILLRRGPGQGAATASSTLLVLAVLAQAGLGVWTLLAQVPMGLALAHQGGAVVLFGLALHHLHVVGRPGRT